MRFDGLSVDVSTRCRWDKCDMVFSNSRLALNHLRLEHQVRESNGNCLWRGCNFRSSTKDVHNHLKKHFKIVEAVCELCPVVKSFKWRFDLSKHLRITHEDQLYEIEQKRIEGFNIYIAIPIVASVLPVSLQNLLN